LFDDLIAVIQESGNRLLVSWFPEDTKQLQKKRPTTAGFKLKTSCDALMDALSRCSPHYIRCIKPNDNKAYHDWDAQRVRHQVQYLGLLENVRVRRAGFAYRAEFDRFLKRCFAPPPQWNVLLILPLPPQVQEAVPKDLGHLGRVVGCSKGRLSDALE